MGTSIYNGANLTLSSNNIAETGAITSNGTAGKITSPVTITVLDNQPIVCNAYDIIPDIYAKVTDDNGNIIVSANNTIKLGFNLQGYDFTYSETDGLYHKYNTKLTKTSTPTAHTSTKNAFSDLTVIASEFTVNKLDPTLTLTYENVAYPDDVIISISLLGKEGETAIKTTSSVKFNITVNGITYPVTITNGTGSLTVPGLTPDDYVINASFSGSTYYNPVEKTYDLTVFEKTGTFKDLQARIDAAEGFIYLPDYNFAYDPEYDGDDLSNGVIINKTIIIFGTNNIINGSDAARIFKVDQSTEDLPTFFLLSNVTLANGKADNGAGVYVSEGTYFNPEDVKFIENTATYRGGAIYSEGTVDVVNSVFDKNDITYRSENSGFGGAAIYNKDGTLTLTGCNVTNNLKDYVIRGTDDQTGDLVEGVIVTSGYNLFKNTKFENNSGCYGADITITKLTEDSILNIDNCTFTGATSYAGDVYVYNAVANINNSKFENNLATGVGSEGYTSAGGAISGLAGSEITVSNSEFKNNSAPIGGAIFVEATPTAITKLTVDNCTFELNNATKGVNDGGKGGAIYAAKDVILDVDDSRFINNAATGLFNYGAGIFVDYNATASVTDSNFTGNTGSLGKAIFNYGTLSESGNKVDASATRQIHSIGTMTSKLIITIYQNNTVDVRSKASTTGLLINSTITDGDGNEITGIQYNITVGDVANIKNTANKHNWKNVVNGTYLLNVIYPSSQELVVNTAVLRVHNTLSDLVTLINKNRNGTLDLDGDYAYDELFDTALTDGIVIKKNITINGNNHIINGSNQVRLFNITGDNILTLKNLTVANGAAEKGAGVYVSEGATLNANNVDFLENTATYKGGAIYSEGTVNIDTAVFDSNNITARSGPGSADNGGAAIYNHLGTLTVNNANIVNNLLNVTVRNGASGDVIDGVVVTTGDAVITNSYFANNSGCYGGAITSLGYYADTPNTLTVEDCVFEGNNATFGGAIFGESTNVVVKHSSFNNNGAYGVGSAGTANTQGGAIIVHPTGSSLTVSDSNFTENTAKVGGAISLSLVDGASSITNCTFTDNTATSEGGAIYNYMDGATLIVKDSTFSGNTAPWGNAISNNGPLALEGNTITGTDAAIGNYYGEIISDVNVTILGNQTVPAELGKTVILNATITDDNGNMIIDNNFRFTVNGETVDEINVDRTTGLYTAEYTIETAGENVVSTSTYENPYLGILDVPKANVTEFIVTVEDIIDGEVATVSVTLTGIEGTPLSGDVKVIINNTEYIIAVSEGTGSKTIEGLAHGSYPVVAMLDESANYNSAINSTVFYVKAATVLTIDEIGEVEYGEPIEATIHLKDKEGNGINGVVVVLGTNVLVEDGVGVLTIDTQPVGTYELTAEYAGTNDYNASASETVSFTVITTDAVIDFHHRVTESGEDGVLFGGIANVLRDDDGNIVYDEEGNPVPDDESYVDVEFTLIFEDQDGVEVLKLEGLSPDDGAIDLPGTGDLPIGKYTVTVVLDDNYNLLADTFEFEVNPKSAQVGVALDEIDIVDGETTTIHITVGEGQVFAFTSYGDEDCEIEYGTGTVLVIEDENGWTKVRVLTNDADEGYVGQEFYVESNDEYWHRFELFYDEGETSTGIFVRIAPAGVVPQDIDGTATITIYGDDDGNVIQVIENVPITEGKADYELPVLPMGEYYFSVHVDADGYDIEDGEFYDCLVVWVKEGTYTHLQQIINDGINDEDRYNEEDNSVWIDLDNDFAFDPDYDAALVGGVVIDSDKIVKINGNEHTISGSDLARIFYITEGTQVELMNVVLADGAVTDNGAAIYSAGNLTVHDSVFKDNKVTEGTTWAPGAPAAGGAAIYSAPGSSLEIWSVEFLNNEAVHGFYNSFTCGAVYASGAEYVSIRDSKFEGNAAVLGGAVTIEFYHVDADSQDEEPTISNCDFNDNLAWQGGAVNINEDVPYLNIADCRFNGNQAVDPNSGDASPAGGAISVGTGSYGTELVLNYCGFLGNSATNVGGAVALINPVCELYANGCEFESNTATYGGAIYFYGNEAVITDTNFASNDPDYGGALFIATGDVSLDNVEFSENSADYGGAIYLANGASLDIANARFYENVATNRGGAIFASGDLTVKDTEFNGNSITEREANAAGQETGGAAIYVGTSGVANVKDSRFTNSNPDYELGDKVYGAVLVAGTAEFDGCNFEDNKARWGAAIGVNGDIGETGAAYVKVANSYFARNEAVEGGAIHIENASMDIEGCDFDANVAKVASGAYAQGAAIYVNGGQFDITGTNFRNGNSEQNSGAIHVFQTESFGDSTITNCNFDDNYAGLYYGAIYFYAPEDSLTITGSNFNNNKAQNTEVGAIRFMGKDLTISGTNFNNNEDPKYGAVYYYTYSDAGKLTITDSSFRNNKGTAYSGALFIYNGEATVDNTQFAYNEGGLGAIWNYAGTLTVTNSLFEDNSGRANMYNIYTQSGTTSISGTTFKIIRNVAINAEDTYVYGADIPITGTFDWGVNKYPIDMEYTLNGNAFTYEALNGKFSIVIDTQPDVGTYTMTIKSFTDEDGNYYVVDAAEKTFEVIKATPILEVEGVEDLMPGDTATVGITLTGALEEGIAGTVIVTVDGKDYVVYTDENGEGSLDIAGLANGKYPITAKFIGNDNYKTVTNDTEFINFYYRTATFDIVIENVTYGDAFNIIVENATDADGNPLSGVVSGSIVNVDGDSVELHVDVTGGSGTATVKLAAGDYAVTARFTDEGMEYISETKEFTINVAKAEPTVGVTYADGEFTITLDGVSGEKLNETLTVAIDGTPIDLAATTVNGTFTFADTGIAPGKHFIEVSFAGNDNYLGSDGSLSFDVSKANNATVTITPSKESYAYGEDVVINVTLADGETGLSGIVIVTVGGVDYAVNVTDGAKSLTVKGLSNNTYTVTAKFIGNDNYDAADAQSATVVVNATTELTITVTANEPVYGQNAVLTVTVTDAAGNTVAVDKVNVTLDGVTAEYAVENGDVTLGKLSGGSHTATVAVVDDETVIGSSDSITFTVEKVSMRPTVTVPEEVTIGDKFTVTASDYFGEASVEINGKTYALGDEISLPEGTFNVKVIFAGNENYTGTTVDKNVTVVKKSVSPETALKTTIPENSTAPVFSIELPEDATGYLLVDIDGEQYYAPLENGKASIAVDPLAGGNHTATITYTGDENYAGITNTTTVSIASNITADTALDIPTNSETTSPTFSVNLPADATGYLVVDVDGKKYAAVVENGTASVTVPGLSEGDHNVTVTYSGDSKYPSLSKDATVNVHVPVYNITNNKNISVVYSTKVYYKVLVTKDGKAVGAGETVTIKYNGKTYKVKTDKNGYASLKLKTNIKVKKYAITATYKGVTVKNTVRIKHVIKVYNKKAKRSKKLVLKIKTKKVNGKYLKGKKLKLKFRGKTYKAKINKKGVAKFTIKKKVMRKLKVGKKYKYRVTYGKDKITKKIKIKA